MEDPSDRLRRDQDNQNRKRENDRYDRRHAINTLRSRLRIEDLNARIDAGDRKRRSDEAFEAMTAGWPEARAQLEGCTFVAPDIRASWLKTFDAIRSSADPSQGQSLVELENDVTRRVSTLSGISAALRQAAESRKAPVLARSLRELTSFREPTLAELVLRPPSRRGRTRVRSELLPAETFPWSTGRSRRADDLQPIHDGLLMNSSVPDQVRFAWLARLDEIDQRDTRLLAPSPVEKIEALISDIDTAAGLLRDVGTALESQAFKCRLFWRR